MNIGNLTQLQLLKIAENELQSIPGSIVNLKQLEELDLSGNSLERLPMGIAELPQLKRLYLYDNKISTAILTALKNKLSKNYLIEY